MTESLFAWKSPCPADVIEVRLVAQPRFASLTIRHSDGHLEIKLVNPSPMTSLVLAFDECWELRVIDRNVEDKSQLEYGRYRVELWDEDDCFADVACDKFEVWRLDQESV